MPPAIAPEAMAKTVSFSMRALPALEFTLREAAVRRGYRGGEFCKREGRELVKLLCDGSDKRDKRAEDDNGLKTDRADDPFQ
jgi:hypothetical protein